MTIRRSNPRKQGEIGLAAAINHFVGCGYAVAIPLADNQPWDLVVDDGTGPLRVQVKTTTARAPSGCFAVKLCTTGGNQSFHRTKPFDPSATELLFVLTDERDVYVIPTSAVRARNQLNLTSRLDRFRQGSWTRSGVGAGQDDSGVVGGGFEPP